MSDLVGAVPAWTVAVAATITALGVIWTKTVKPIIDTLRRVEHALDYVFDEMHRNGGTTARDAIQRIDDAVRGLDARLSRIEANINERDPS